MKFETERIHFWGDVQSLPLPWAHYEREGRACVLSRAIAHLALHIHRIHKWRTRGKKLMPSHESEALEGKQKLQIKTFSELAECLARIPPKITLYGRLFKYNDVGRLLL